MIQARGTSTLVDEIDITSTYIFQLWTLSLLSSLATSQNMSSFLERLTSYSIFLTLPASLLIAAVGLVIYRLTVHPLAHFPGPFEAKIWGSWRNRRYWRGQWHEDILELHRLYGPAVRIAPNELSLVDAGALRLLYNHGTRSLKTDW